MTTYNWLSLAVIAGLCVLGTHTAPAEEIDSQNPVAIENPVETDLEPGVSPTGRDRDGWNQRDTRSDQLGDRIDQRLNRRGDRINARLDRRADRARKKGHPRLADRLDKRRDRIDRRLDRRRDRQPPRPLRHPDAPGAS